MCTVTYLPYRSGYILTHNRDEAPSRSPKQIEQASFGLNTLIFPRDTKAGGSWIAASSEGRTACLLNGAFVKHQHRPPYRRSRGLVLLDFFDWPDADSFFADYDLTDIEPFTMLLFEPDRLVDFRWDGEQRHLSWPTPGQAHFWCSATLYPPDMQARREQVFRNWLTNFTESEKKIDADATNAQPRASIIRHTEYTPTDLLELHRTGSVDDPQNDFIMNREEKVKTVSITQIVCQPDHVTMHYFDLQENTEVADSLRIR